MIKTKSFLISLIAFIVGVISFVLCYYAIYEPFVSLLISAILVGFIAKGLNIFDKFDELIVSAIIGFFAVYVSIDIFIPFASLVGWVSIIYGVIAAFIALFAQFVKIQFLKPYMVEELNKPTSSHCPKCGSELPNDATFCDKCGAKL